jgi:outer membrane protein insertion porin family
MHLVSLMSLYLFHFSLSSFASFPYHYSLFSDANEELMTKSLFNSLLFIMIFSLNNLFGVVLQYENQRIERIEIESVNATDGKLDASSIKIRMKTKEGDLFSQIDFDNDLKALVNEFDRVDPSIAVVDDKLVISLKMWTRPTIRTITWSGNHCISTENLQEELGITAFTVFDRQFFNKAFHKLKAYYVKNGYFEATLEYRVIADTCTNTVDIEVEICEGRAGRIKKIEFVNFAREEEDKLLELMITKRYFFLSSWYTGQGNYNEEAVQQDRFTILNFLQNQGYADAVVDIDIKESPKPNRIVLTITAQRGELYNFGSVSFEGNKIFSDEEIINQFVFNEGDSYSPDDIRETVKRITDFYGRRGYIDAVVDYEPSLDCESRTFSIKFHIEEGEKYYVGLVKVYGNCSTQTNVILHETLLIPGEVFNIIKLQLTEEKLQNIGFFKNVNVYAVRSEGPCGLGKNYRDVHIEVEETITGNFGAGFGLSTAESIFGEFKITERNFNYRGLGCIFSEGLSKLRGGGEFVNFNAMIGAKSRKYGLSWTKPFFRDTPWIVGFEIEYSNNRYISNDYEINALSGTIHGAYPLNQFLRLGLHYRLTYTDIDLNKGKVKKQEIRAADNEAKDKETGQTQKAHEEREDLIGLCKLKEETRNAGAISAIGINLNYDSTNSPVCPTRGVRSRLEQELAGFGGKQSFMGLAYLNTFYKGLGDNGILKFRADMRFIVPLFDTKRYEIPLNERLFLGGENMLRGYRVYRLGPQYNEGDPRGGMSLQLLSLEYTKYLHKKVSAFVFCDSGHLSFNVWNFGTMWTSVGFGLNLRIFDGAPPVVLGIGFPLNPDHRGDVQRFFFNLGGRF